MRILVLHSAGDLYGSGKILAESIEVLRRRGHLISVLVASPGPLVDHLREQGFDVKVMDLAILRRRYQSFGGMVYRMITTITAVMRLIWTIRKYRIDLVYSNTLAVLAGAIAARVTGRIHIWHIHEIIESPRVLTSSLRWAIQHMSRLSICVSLAVQEHWAEGRAEVLQRLRLVYNGLARPDPSPIAVHRGPYRLACGLDPEGLLIGVVGRIHYWKGQDYFLDISAHILRDFPDCQIAFVGDAFPGYEYLYGDLQKKANDLGISEQVRFLGFRSDIWNFMHSIDILVVPSIKPDPLPTVVLEGMLAKLPIVGSSIGGIPEMIVDGVTGILIPPTDAAQAYRLMRPLIQDGSLRLRYGAAGLERVTERYSSARFESEIVTLFSQLERECCS